MSFCQYMTGDHDDIRELTDKPNAKCIYLFGNSYPPLFTVTKAGRLYATGVNKAGYIAFGEYMEANKAARNDTAKQNKEKAMLAKIKAANNITHNSVEEEEEAKRRASMNADTAASENLPDYDFDYEIV